MRYLLILLVLFGCTKKPTPKIESVTFKYVFKSYGSNTMTCISNTETDVKTGYYERSENYSINIGDLVHGSKQVFIKCTSLDSVQVFGYINDKLNYIGSKDKVSSGWITYTW